MFKVGDRVREKMVNGKLIGPTGTVLQITSHRTDTLVSVKMDGDDRSYLWAARSLGLVDGEPLQCECDKCK